MPLQVDKVKTVSLVKLESEYAQVFQDIFWQRCHDEYLLYLGLTNLYDKNWLIIQYMNVQVFGN